MKVDEFGFWRASFRGGSKVERLRSHTSAGLLEQLREKFDVLERAKQAKRDEREAKRKAKADAREAARKRRLEERAARKPAKAGR